MVSFACLVLLICYLQNILAVGRFVKEPSNNEAIMCFIISLFLGLVSVLIIANPITP